MNQDGVRALNSIYEYLRNNYNVEKIINRITRDTVGGVRINIPNSSLLHEKCPEATYVSLIISPEHYNKTIYETALASNSDIIYNEEIGYGDVIKFETQEQVDQELERLGLRNR